MRTKTTPKLAPVKVIKEETLVIQDTPPETPAIGAAISTEEQKTESNDALKSESKTTKPPRKKLRRPVLSDTVPAIPVASFRRMARTMANNCKSDLRWEADALEALQVAAEAFMVEKFQKAKQTSQLFDRKTLGVAVLRA
jgi:histone H3/H4